MNRIAKAQLDALIRNRQFAELFIQCGWDAQGVGEPLELPLPDDGESLPVEVVAEKRGFAVCVCDAGAAYPQSASARRRLVNQLSRHHYEHLLILCGEDKQCWSAAIRPHNRPLRTVEVEWNERQDIQPLKEKLDGIIFDISDEENLGITDVVEQVRSAFMENAERVTRKFYREFSAELTAFAEFIGGINAQITREWYAALMLNRLMFIYFIQKKGFLDNDSNYLENRLTQTRQMFGKDQFEEKFYRHFLRRLFSEGLGTPPEQRAPELHKLLGKVPYLNGGLFDVHEIEKHHRAIAIPDAAFEKLFAFFGKYRWHLDTRPTASGRDINPDVIGYIFEKYINDRAAMGAYYTQEDITGYIARNTIIPYLLQRARDKCKHAFDAHTGIWRLLRDNPDNYIYDAVKKGGDLPDREIPDDIRRGIDAAKPHLLARRQHWNNKAEPRFALPTETWRETIARRQRYFALKAKMRRGEINQIDHLITHNLDIERFAADALRDYEGSDFIAAFFEAIAGRKAHLSNQSERRGITVLDPACGSGAFLFAALNILEPLYEKCIERMREFVEMDDAAPNRKGAKKHQAFRAVLRDIDNHQNQKYWIYKTIILNNLYGVDLMKEAAEIAKLRLFLKLAAQAQYDPAAPNLGLEPLPDIDFNIRAGNSLVGFANMAQFEQAVAIDPQSGQRKVELDGALIRNIRERAGRVQLANQRFRQAQDSGGEDYRLAKDQLSARLDELNREMNGYLAKQYGNAKDDRQWLESHRPFHWLTEFYGIVEQDGGFDVVIGNPPYVSVTKAGYQLVGDPGAFKCPDLYGHMTKKALELTSPKGQVGFIVMHSLAFSHKFSDARKVILEMAGSAWFSFYGRIPSGLFSSDVRVRNCIMLASRDPARQTHTARLHRWNAEHRDCLFPLLHYTPFCMDDTVPMFNDSAQVALLEGWKYPPLSAPNKQSGCVLQFKTTAYNFISISPDEPPCFDSQGQTIPQTSIQKISFKDGVTQDLAMLLFGGRMFFAIWLIYGYDFNVTLKNLTPFGLPISKFSPHDREKLAMLAEEFKNKFPKTLQFKLNAGKRVGAFNTSKLWHITDQSDMIFLRHMTDMPELAFESIRLHVAQTIKTERNEK